MPKKPLIISGVIVGLVLLGGTYLLMAPEKDGASVTQSPSANNTTIMPEAAPSTSNGAYMNYEEGIIAKTSGTKLLFFYAPWCPQCRDLDKDIKEKGVPSGVTIIKVDYDTSQTLRKKYGVTIQTTIVKVDDAGNLVKKFVAYDDPSLNALKANLL